MGFTLFFLLLMTTVFNEPNTLVSKPLEELKTEVVGPIRIKITGKLHRKRGTNRDGIPCDCSNCFGLCDVRFEVDLRSVPSKDERPMILQFEPQLNTGRIYLLQSESYFQPSFIIDDHLILRTQNRTVLGGVTSLDVQAGQYEFKEHQGCMYFEGRYIDYVGYIDINIQKG